MDSDRNMISIAGLYCGFHFFDPGDILLFGGFLGPLSKEFSLFNKVFRDPFVVFIVSIVTFNVNVSISISGSFIVIVIVFGFFLVFFL